MPLSDEGSPAATGDVQARGNWQLTAWLFQIPVSSGWWPYAQAEYPDGGLVVAPVALWFLWLLYCGIWHMQELPAGDGNKDFWGHAQIHAPIYIYIYIYHQIFYAPYTNISLQLTKNMYNYMIFILYLCFYLFISRTIMHICINIWNYIQLCTEISYVSTLCLYIFWAFVRTPMSSSKIVNTYFVFSDRQSPMSSQKSISTYTWW